VSADLLGLLMFAVLIGFVWLLWRAS